jgi:hypothetical protein
MSDRPSAIATQYHEWSSQRADEGPSGPRSTLRSPPRTVLQKCHSVSSRSNRMAALQPPLGERPVPEWPVAYGADLLKELPGLLSARPERTDSGRSAQRVPLRGQLYQVVGCPASTSVLLAVLPGSPATNTLHP